MTATLSLIQRSQFQFTRAVFSLSQQSQVFLKDTRYEVSFVAHSEYDDGTPLRVVSKSFRTLYVLQESTIDSLRRS